MNQHPIITLTAGDLQASFMPTLGGRMSLFGRVGQRQWMYHPGGIWPNAVGDSFKTSTHIGLDECFPTIGPCRVDGVDLADHGQVWAVPWQVHSQSAHHLTLSVDVPHLPLRFTRTATLTATALTLDYHLENLGAQPHMWGWAFHGLLGIQPGDRVELPEDIHDIAVNYRDACIPVAYPACAWPQPAPTVNLADLQLGPVPACFKGVARPQQQGWARLAGADGQALDLTWDVQQIPFLGLWITRGGYLDQHHMALEPTTLPGDFLDRAGAHQRRLAPGATAQWSVTMLPHRQTPS